MTKEEFLKKLTKNLQALPPKDRQEELKSYESLQEFNLDPTEVANKIYIKRGMYKYVRKPIKLFDAATIITKELQEKNQEKIKDILIFFLVTILIIIIIKVPFIYVRDMLSNLFNDTFKNDSSYTILYLSTEIIYAITGIVTGVNRIKRKAIEIEMKNSAK